MTKTAHCNRFVEELKRCSNDNLCSQSCSSDVDGKSFGQLALYVVLPCVDQWFKYRSTYRTFQYVRTDICAVS